MSNGVGGETLRIVVGTWRTIVAPGFSAGSARNWVRLAGIARTLVRPAAS